MSVFWYKFMRGRTPGSETKKRLPILGHRAVQRKRYKSIVSKLVAGGLILLAILVWGWQGGVKAHAMGLILLAQASPLYDYDYKVSLEATRLEGRVGIPALIRLNISPYPPPAGFFYSSVADFLEGPEGAKPKIVSGDREIQVHCPTAGNYLLLVTVNLISKSSCGGARAYTIKEQKVRLVILR